MSSIAQTDVVRKLCARHSNGLWFRTSWLFIVWVVALCAALELGHADEIDSAPPSADGATQGLLDAAAADVERAAAGGNMWLGTRELLMSARAHYAAGDHASAVLSAQKAQRRALLAINQASLERARYLFDRISEKLAPRERKAVRELLRVHDGDTALRLVEKLSSAQSNTKPRSDR